MISVKKIQANENAELNELVKRIKTMTETGCWEGAVHDIALHMGKFPHSPIPHNLMGIILEYEGEHANAMKHFRAAFDLDPTYRPAKENMNSYSQCGCQYKAIFEEKDCENSKVIYS